MMDKRLLIAITVSVLAILALPALAAPDYAQLRESVENDHIRPGYAHFAEKAKGLDYAIRGHCKNTGENPDRLAVQTAFHDALDAWQAVQHIRHGAVAEEDRHARLQFWPDRRGIAERHMRKLLAEPLSDTLMDDIATTSVALQGFPALERLLFGSRPLSQHAIEPEKAARCPVALAIAHNIAEIASALAAETRSADGKAYVTDAVNDLVVGIEFIQALKLKLPAGARKPRPFLLENWRSARSLRNVEINIRALREFYKSLAAGLPGSDERTSIILDAFEAAEDAIRAMGGNGKVLLSEDGGPGRFRTLAAILEQLRNTIGKSIPEQLGITLGFNSLDGD